MMARVYEIQPEKGCEALIFAAARRLVSQDEITAIRTTGQIPMKMPSPSQSKILLLISNRLYEEGFKI
jgi:hypothetical protein